MGTVADRALRTEGFDFEKQSVRDGDRRHPHRRGRRGDGEVAPEDGRGGPLLFAVDANEAKKAKEAGGHGADGVGLADPRYVGLALPPYCQ